MAIIGDSITSTSSAIVELLPKTASGLSNGSAIANVRTTLNLSDSINNYRFIQLLMCTTLSGYEFWQSQLIVVPLYNEERINLSIYSDSNTSYYCLTESTLTGSSLNIYQAAFSNYSSPAFRVIGIK